MSKPSTKLGNALGTAMVGAAYTADCLLPLAAIRTYWLIPADRRFTLFGGPSASVGAYAKIKRQGGGGWQVIRSIAVSNHPPRPVPGS